MVFEKLDSIRNQYCGIPTQPVYIAQHYFIVVMCNVYRDNRYNLPYRDYI